jgi:hypothetical protein
MSRTWKTYDPGWLVKLAKEQHSDFPWLAEALTNCTRASWESKAYVHFVDPTDANKPGAEWQIDCNMTLNDEEHGELILDILKGQRVGGVEFYDRLD